PRGLALASSTPLGTKFTKTDEGLQSRPMPETPILTLNTDEIVPPPALIRGSDRIGLALVTTMLARLGRWHVHRRILFKKTSRFKHEASVGNRHHRPVFRTRDMMNAHGIPGDKVPILQRPISRYPLCQPIGLRILVDVIPGGVPLSRIVGCDP